MTTVSYEIPESHRKVVDAAVQAILKVMGIAEPHYPTSPWLQHKTEHHYRKGHLHAMRAFEDKDSKDWGSSGGTPSTGCLDAEHALTRLAMGLSQYAGQPEPTIILDSDD